MQWNIFYAQHISALAYAIHFLQLCRSAMEPDNALRSYHSQVQKDLEAF